MAHAVVRTVTEAVAGRRVRTVTLDVGVASGVVPEALRFAWDVACSGTPLAGSALAVRTVPLQVSCTDCGQTGAAADPLRVRCPGCDSRAVSVVGGRELEIATVEVDDLEPGSADRQGVEIAGVEPVGTVAG